MHLPRLPPPLRMTRRWLSLTISSCPLRLGLPFIFFTYCAGFVTLPFRGVGVGCEDLHLRLIFYFVESGLPLISNNSVYSAHQSGLVL